MSGPRRMSSASRLALAIAVTVALLFASAVGALAALVYSTGTVSVEVAQVEGQDLSIGVPAALITLALMVVPDDLYAEAAHELRPYWPAVREFCRQLGDCPDAVFVEVRGGEDELVIVSKREDRLLVHVQEDESRVHVAIPLYAVQTVANRLERHLR